jgi:hypothetical protein
MARAIGLARPCLRHSKRGQPVSRSGQSQRSVAAVSRSGQSQRSVAKVAPTPGAAHPDLLHALIRFNRGRGCAHIGGSAQDGACGEAEGSRTKRNAGTTPTVAAITIVLRAGSGTGTTPASSIAASHGSAATVATMGAWTTSGTATASSVNVAAAAGQALSIGGAGRNRNADQRRRRCHQYGRILHVIFLSTWALLDAGIGSLAAPSSASTSQA